MKERVFLETAQIKPRSFQLLRRKINWRLLFAWEVPLLLLCGAALQYWNTRPPIIPASIGVAILESPKGQLKISWNSRAQPVAAAAQGIIEVTDGIETQSIPLTPAMLALGGYSYRRATSDVDVRLTVTDSAGNQLHEGSRFLGQPLQSPANVADRTGLNAETRDLQKQLQWLRKKRSMQALRIRQLQIRLKNVETKLGITHVP